MSPKNPDDHINYKIYAVQFVVWCIILFISKILIFGFEVIFYRPIAGIGTTLLSVFDGYPRMELLTVMIIIPVCFNSALYWVSDTFLKGDKHIENRKSQ
jgi:hypothetical protein